MGVKLTGHLHDGTMQLFPVLVAATDHLHYGQRF